LYEQYTYPILSVPNQPQPLNGRTKLEKKRKEKNPRIESKLLIYIHALHTIQKKQRKKLQKTQFLECNVATGISRPPHSFSSGDDFHERGGRNITFKHPKAEYHGISRYIPAY
jgi:hypothetical protein